uniref:ShKT domain-containing protein n=1 Tax=Anisakis simplex TaxID=6269 RepID=A0A0M3JZ43_ANISI
LNSESFTDKINHTDCSIPAKTQVSSSDGCYDSDKKCSIWASQGECQSNAVWMMSNCRLSCHSCQGGDNAWKLRAYIASTYDNDTSRNANIYRRVQVQSIRLIHVEMDEEKQDVQMHGRMVLSWNDTKIAWNRQQWGVSWVNFYWVQIWTPQLIQLNAPSSLPATISNKVLAANHTGQVYMWLDFTFNAPYHFQYEHYPNDYQKICYKFGDKNYLSTRFTVSDEVKSKKREELSNTHASGWTIESLQVQDNKYASEMLSDWRRDPYDLERTNCELCAILKRNSVYFISEMLMPSLITSMITIASPLLQLSSNQSLVAAFSILAQIFSLSLINQRLPAFAAHTPTILKYAAFNLVMSGVVFIVSLILRRIAQTESTIPPPHVVDQFVTLINRFLPISSSPASTKEVDNSRNQHAPFAHCVNNLMFLFTLCIYLIVITASFIF